MLLSVAQLFIHMDNWILACTGSCSVGGNVHASVVVVELDSLTGTELAVCEVSILVGRGLKPPSLLDINCPSVGVGLPFRMGLALVVGITKPNLSGVTWLTGFGSGLVWSNLLGGVLFGISGALFGTPGS